MANRRPLFVAETNDRGQVVWVWVQDRPGQAARPVRRVARHLPASQEPGAQFAGAPPEAIVNWMKSASRGAPRP